MINNLMKHSVLLAICIALGCKHEDSSSTALVAAIDVSSPSEERLVKYGSILYHAQRGVGRDGALIVHAFDYTPEQVYEGTRLTSRAKFNERLGSEVLKSFEDESEPGTRTELVLEAVVKDAKRSSLPTSILICTDGGIEDLSKPVLDSIASSFEELASLSHVEQVVIAGVLPEHRAQWKEWLAPLEARGKVRGLNDAEEAVKQLGGNK